MRRRRKGGGTELGGENSEGEERKGKEYSGKEGEREHSAGEVRRMGRTRGSMMAEKERGKQWREK